jgi:adenosylhomocysteine nucleosidase
MIAIIAAMDKELNTLLESLATSEIRSVADKTFYLGTIAGKDVVVAKSGIGKVNAAVTTALLLDEYEITCLINTGLAGGLSPAKCGDIVVSSQVAYSDVDFRAVNPELPFGQMEGEPFVVKTDPKLLQDALDVLKQSKTPHRLGTIVSGDQFVTSVSQLAPVIAHFSDVVACEMEGMAVAVTAWHFHVPCIILRGISDVIDAPGQVRDYFEVASRIAAKTTGFVLEFLKRQ